MNVLGIETSCDETSAAVVRNGRTILSNIVTSSLKEHKKYGGIIPEIASRRQLEWITTIVEEALAQANVQLDDIDAIAVTQKPGLIGSLLVGIAFAQSLSFALRKPLMEVDHIQAHIYANFLAAKATKKAIHLPKLPAIGLVVSGGHSSLFYIPSFKDYKRIGQTRDDAVGEAFDKVARILGLGYPGGPIIDRLAQRGVNRDLHFACAELPKTLDFSFSGIKTAVLYYKREHEHKSHFSPAKIAYAFQESVVSVIVKKCMEACLKYNTKTLLVGGGVAANSCLRTRLKESSVKHHIDVSYPPLNLCLDNAAMVAGLGYQLHQK